MNTQVATLVAASIAAVAAIGTLVVNTVTAALRERREAHRKAVEIELPNLAEALHSIVATSFPQHRNLEAGKSAAAKNWRNRGLEAKVKLDRVRPRVRYSLSGIDPGLRNLARLPSWVANHNGRPSGQVLLDRADILAAALHDAIERSWRSGKRPPVAQRAKIDKLVQSFREYGPESLGQQADAEEPVDDIDE